ncbi:MAG: bile acid:sodium symporter family protein [Bacteroidota bacterium]
MSTSVLTDIFLPASLFIIMLGMGLSLVVDDFKRVATQPKATIIGLINQIILLPLIGFAITQLFNLNNQLAIGMMLIAACPGGVTSNLISHVSRGDTALSISLTAISSLISLLTIPLIMGFAFQYFSDNGQVVDIDEMGMILQIVVIVLVPVTIGMIIRSRNEAFAKKMDRPVRIFSATILAIIIIGIMVKESELIRNNFASIGLSTALLNLLTMLLGWLSARLFSLNLKQSITIAIESGIQNGTLAIVIASTVLNDIGLAIPTSIYTIWMFATGGFMMYRFGRRSELAEMPE